MMNWKNLFDFQRIGGSKREIKNQLENNTTKSFLIVLREETGRRLTKGLFEKLNIETPSDSEPDDFHFKNQMNIKNIKKIPKEAEIFLVGISSQTPPQRIESSDDKGRVDGVIEVKSENAGDVILAIEVKTMNDSLTADEIGKYKNGLDIDDNHVKFLQWQEIYDLLEEELVENSLDEKNNFLVEKFKEYLEEKNMVPFQGFSEKSLDYMEEYDSENAVKFWKEGRTLLEKIEQNLKSKDWFNRDLWETNIDSRSPTRQGRKPLEYFLRIEKVDPDWDTSLRYQFTLAPEVSPEVSDKGELLFSLYIGLGGPYENRKEFTRKLFENIDDSTRNKLKDKGFEFRKPENLYSNIYGNDVGFLHYNISMLENEGINVVDKAIEAMKAVVKETKLTKHIDETLR